MTEGNRQVFLGTRDGMGIKFTETDVRPMGRDTTGVKGIELREGDEVVEMDLVDEEGTLLAVTALGFGKRTDVSEYRHQNRGGTGVINVRVTEKNGPVVGIKSVGEDDQLLVITRMGMMIRFPAAEVRETGRAAQGVKVIDLDEGDAVVAVAKLASLGERDEAPEEPEDADAAGGAAPSGDEPESE